MANRVLVFVGIVGSIILETVFLGIGTIAMRERETALQFFARLNAEIPFWNFEEQKLASNSFLRRKIAEGAILFNGERMAPNEIIDFPIFSLVMFPRSPFRKCTLV